VLPTTWKVDELATVFTVVLPRTIDVPVLPTMPVVLIVTTLAVELLIAYEVTEIRVLPVELAMLMPGRPVTELLPMVRLLASSVAVGSVVVLPVMKNDDEF